MNKWLGYRWARSFSEHFLGESVSRDGDGHSGVLSEDEDYSGGGDSGRHSNESVTDAETESEETADSSSRTQEYSGEDDYSPQAKSIRACSDHWNEDYMSVVPRQLYRKELPRLVDAYRAFQRHLTPQVPHYLLAVKERDLMEQSVVGRTLYVSPQQRGVLSTVAGHTYLVRRDLHYLYAYLITRALVGTKESDDVREERRLWMRRQTKAMRFCEQSHLGTDSYGRVCRHCTVLYTRRRGELFQRVQQLSQNNTQLAPSESLYGRVEPLSFHLVNFLCGPLQDESQMEKLHLNAPFGQCDSFTVDPSEATDWVAVHPVYLDIWQASQYGAAHASTPTIQRYNNNNTNNSSSTRDNGVRINMM